MKFYPTHWSLLFLSLFLFVCSMVSAQNLPMAIPAHTADFCCAGTRGYHFVAPVAFTITGLRVPDDFQFGNLPQSVAVVRFNGSPPIFPAITNSFTLLHRTVSQPGNLIIPVCIPVAAGDRIGIYGDREGNVSYGTAAFSAHIFGQGTTLIRSGMNFSLQQNPPRDLWAQNDKIGRIEMFYTGPVPAVPGLVSGNMTVCQGQTANYSVPEQNNVVYNWSGLPPGADFVSGQGTAQVTVNWGTAPVGVHRLEVRACRSECNACSAPTFADVNLLTVPQVNAQISGADTVCNGQTDDFDLTGNLPPGLQYEWSVFPPAAGSFPNGNSGTQTSVHWNQAGNVSLRLTPSNICGAGNVLQKNIFIHTFPVPQPVLTQADSVICPGEELTEYKVISVPGVRYTWSGFPPEVIIFSGQNTAALRADWAATPPGSYLITVTPSNVCGSGTARSFRVRVQLPPQIPSGIFGNVTVCLSPGVYIYNVNQVPGTTFEWETSCSPVTITPLNPAGSRVRVDFTRIASPVPFACELKAKAVNECGQSPFRVYNLMVIGPPGTSASVSGGNNVCVGQSVSYNATPTQQASSYVWSVSPPGGHTFLTPNGQPSVQFLWTSPGTYTVNVTAVNACGQGSPRSYIVTVNASPAVPILTSSSDPVCPGQQGAVYAVRPVPGVQFVWSLPPDALLVSGQNTASVSVNWNNNTPPGVHFLRVTGFNGTCAGISLTVPVRVERGGVPVPVNLRGPSDICSADTVLIYQSDPVSGAQNYLWENLPVGASIVSGAGTERVSIRFLNVLPGIYPISLRAVTACGTGPAAVIRVEVKSAPQIPVFRPIQSNICSGQPIFLEIENDPSVNFYRWTTDCAGNLIPNRNTAILIPGLSNQTCSVSVRAENGCGQSAAAVRQITVQTVPQLSGGISGPPVVCRNQVAVYQIQNIPGVIYNWSGWPGGASLRSGQNTSSVEINWGTALPGTYTLVVTPRNNCGTGEPSTYRVEVLPALENLSPIIGPETVCIGATATYNVSPIPGANFIWNTVPGLPGFPQQGTSVNINWNQTGTFVLTARSSNVCGAGPTLTKTVTVSDRITADAGPDLTICTNNTTLTGRPSGGTWSCIACQPGTRLISNNSQAILTDIGTGINVLRYTVSGGNCPAAFDEVQLEYAQVSEPMLSADRSFCRTASGTLNLSGLLQTVRVLRWESSVNNFATVTTISNTSSFFNYSNITETTQFRAVVNLPGRICPDRFSNSITVTVFPETRSVPINSVINTCSDGATVNVSEAGGGRFGSWSQISGPVNTLIITSGTVGIISGMTLEGTYVFRRTVNNPPCPVFTTDVTVNRTLPAPPAFVGNNQTVCSAQISLTGNSMPAGTVMRWVQISGPSNVTFSGTPPSITAAGLILPGDYVFEYQAEQRDCNRRSSSRIRIRRVVQPAAPVFTPVQICSSRYTLTQTSPGVWSFGSGPGVPSWSSPDGNNLVIDLLPIEGTYTFIRTVSVPPCNNVSGTFRITRLRPVRPASVPISNLEVCSSGVTLAADAPDSTFTGSWSFVSGPSAAQVLTVVNSGVVTGMNASGNYVFRWTVSSGACGNTFADLTVKKNPEIIPLPNAGNSILVCNISSAVLTGNTPPVGVTSRWVFVRSDNGVTPTVTPAGNNLIVAGMTAAGTYTFGYEFISGNCSPVRSTVNVTRSAPPDVANIQPVNGNNEVCGTSFTVRGNLPAIGTARWEVRGPGNPRLTPSGNVLQISDANVAGDYVVRYIIENVPCPASTAQILVKVNPGGNAGILTADNIEGCENNNTGTLTLSGFDGQIVRWESNSGGSWAIINHTSSSYVYNNLTRSTAFRAVIKQGTCPENASAPIQINLFKTPPPADAGTDVEICSNNITLTGSEALGFNTRWEFLSGRMTPTLTPVGNTVVVTGINLAGTYIFRYTVDGRACGNTSDEIRVTVSESGSAGNLTSDATHCRPVNTGTLILSGYRGNVVRWESSTDNFNTIVTIVSTADRFTYRNLTVNTQFRAVVKSGVCPELFSNIVRVTVRNVPVADAGADVAICTSQYQLIGNRPTPGTGSWSVVRIAPGSSPVISGSGPEATVTGLTSEGVYVFEYTITQPGCPATSDRINVTVNGSSAGGTVSVFPSTVCAGQSVRLRLSGHRGSVVRWEQNPGSGWSVINSTLTDLNLNSVNVSTRYRTAVKNGSCDEVYSVESRVITEDPNFTADAGKDTTLCADTIRLSGNVPPSGTAGWRFLTGPNVPTVSVNGFNMKAWGIVSGIYEFEYEVNRAGCGSTKDRVRISVSEKPAGILTSSDTAFCSSQNNVFGSVRLERAKGTVVRWELSENDFASFSSVANNTNRFQFFNLSRTTSFRAVLANFASGCDTFYTDPLKVRISSPPSVANAGTDWNVCGSQFNLTGNVPQTGQGSWSAVVAPDNQYRINLQNHQLTVTNANPGRYVFVYKIENDACIPSTDTAEVIVNREATGGNITSNTTVICGTGGRVELTLQNYTGTVVGWEQTQGNVWERINENSPVLLLPNLTQTTTFRAVVRNDANCPDAFSNLFTVSVIPSDAGGTLTGGGVYCRQNISGILELQNYSGTIIRWERSTDNFMADIQPVSNSGSSLIFSGIAVKTWFRVIVSHPVCGNDTSSVAVVDPDGGSASGVLSSDMTVCSDAGNGTLTLSGFSGNILRWESSTDGFFNTLLTINHTGSQFNFSGLTKTTYFRSLVKNGNCPQAMSNSVAVTVVPSSIPGVITPNQLNVCINNNTGTFTLTGQTGNVIHWETAREGSNVWTTINNTLVQYTFQNLTQNTKFRAVVKNGNCDEKLTDVVSLTTDENTVKGTIFGAQTICNNSVPVTLTLTGHRGNVVNWERAVDCGNVSVTLPITLPTLTLSGLSRTTCFRARVKNGSCDSELTDAVRITVRSNVNAGVLSGDTSVCSTRPSGSLRLTGNDARVVRWERIENDGSVTVTVGTLTSLNFTGLTRRTLFKVWTRFSECPDSIFAEKYVEVSEPSFGGMLSENQTICNGQNADTLTLDRFSGNIIRWESSPDSLSWIFINNSSRIYVPQNLTATTYFRAVTQNGICEPAFSNVIRISVRAGVQLSAGRVTGCNSRSNVLGLVSGGSPPYIYSLIPALQPPNQTGIFSGLIAGNYILSVTDAQGCNDTLALTFGTEPTPTQVLDIIGITQSSATLRWMEVPPGVGVVYNLRYRIVGDNTWTLISGISTNTRYISNLQNNTTYEAEIQYVCPGGYMSTFSSEWVRTFTTLIGGTGDCATSPQNGAPIPGGVYLSDIRPQSTVVHWNHVPNAQGYIISFGDASENPAGWVQTIVCHPIRSFRMNNLSPNTLYRVRVRTNCSNCVTALNNADTRSPWSNFYSFSTPSNRISENSTSEDILVYPNPFRGSIYFSGLTDEVTFRLTDLNGKLLMSGTVSPERSEILTDTLPTGMYLLKLDNQILKLVKE